MNETVFGQEKQSERLEGDEAGFHWEESLLVVFEKLLSRAVFIEVFCHLAHLLVLLKEVSDLFHKAANAIFQSIAFA